MKKIFTVLLLVGIIFASASTMALVDNNATPETQALYNQLKATSGNQIMFGQYYLAKTSTWEDPYGTNSQCYKITGKVPMILHVDYKSDQWRPITLWTEQLKTHYSKGGIIMVTWHMQNWVTGGDMRDLTGNPIVNILPGGSARAKYLAALDGFANYFLNLKDANGKLIPVIFRPYHENDGGWFWWGNVSGANIITTSTATTTTSKGTISYFSNDAGSGRVRVHYAIVSGKIGSRVRIDGTWNYSGTYDVYNVTPTTFDIAHSWKLGEWKNPNKYWTSSSTALAGTLSSNTAYVALWNDLVTYLRDKKGVHNLLYCYAPEIINGFAYDGPLYPGDSYVDILGLDCYARTVTMTIYAGGSCLSRLQTLYDLSVKKNKPFGLAEGLRNEYPNKVVSNPTGAEGIYPKYWTEQLINPILADSKTKYASFVMVWYSAPGSTCNGWGPVKGYADEQSFRDVSYNTKIKFLKY